MTDAGWSFAIVPALRWESEITDELFANGAEACVSVPGSVTESSAAWARLLASPKLVAADGTEVEESSKVVGRSDEDNGEIANGDEIDPSGCEVRTCVAACTAGPRLADVAAAASDCALWTTFCNGAPTKLFVRAAVVVVPGATI
jgi:hypothetical protein